MFFIHIPKTGGTTFRKLLTTYFEKESYYPNDIDLQNNNGKYLNQRELINGVNGDVFNRKLIMGHYGVNLIKHLNNNVRTLAFFRNPIDRIYSHIEHIRNHDAALKGCDRNTILVERLDHIVNLQARMMGYRGDQDDMNHVRENIMNLDFIGIQEEYTDSVRLCNTKFNWNLELNEKSNESNRDRKFALTPESMSLICRVMAPELKTYNMAYRQFEKRINRMKNTN